MLGGSVEVERITAIVDEVLPQLVSNYEAHRMEYNNAFEEYREVAAAALAERRLALEAVHAIVVGGKPPSLEFDITPPDDHRLEYERAIGMLKLHRKTFDDPTKATIKITPDLYAAYVQDLWGWRDAFRLKNESYSRWK